MVEAERRASDARRGWRWRRDRGGEAVEEVEEVDIVDVVGVVVEGDGGGREEAVEAGVEAVDGSEEETETLVGPGREEAAMYTLARRGG